MKNAELFIRDPRTASLINDGQARLLSDADERAEAMLRNELENFVCEGEYATGLDRILSSFLENLNAASQRAAWVSGFYGSGKSHLLKMLCHLWANTTFADGATARSLVPDLPMDLQTRFKQLDDVGIQAGGGVFSVSGTMPEGTAESARLTVLGIIFRACGLPAAYNQARFCLYLRDKGYFEKVEAYVRNAGKDFNRELTDLYASPLIRRALTACDPGLGDEREVRELLRLQFPNKTDISTEEFVSLAREALQIPGKGQLPLTVIVLDEIQHYIGDNQERSRNITELTEALNKQMGSRVMVVGAGQNALSTDTPQFAWLRDRYTIRVELSDTDVETVIRKVLLRKKPEVETSLKEVLDRNAGEISRQLAKTSIAATSGDQKWLSPDYPILPTRRRFWEQVLRTIDPSGSSSLLRSQLRIIHEALREVADLPTGHVVPADYVFFQLQNALVQQGILSREISDRVNLLKADGSTSGVLKARICGLVFLIRRLSRENGLDIGLRANEEMLADLLVIDLASDGTKIRQELPALLRELVDSSILLYDGHEYNLQTKESAEWDDLFRVQVARVGQDVALVAQERKSRLRAEVDEALRPLRLHQGDVRTPRGLQVFFGHEAPDHPEHNVPVWVRDGWEVGDFKQVQDKAREVGPDSPMLFVWLPKKHEDVFRENLIRMKAAQVVLDIKGEPFTRASEEARDAMMARRKDAEREVEKILKGILLDARVYKGGGVELHALELIDKVSEGASDALKRLFPRFDEADQKGWDVASSRALQGDESPLNAIGWKGGIEEHPVCREILHHVGAGREGRHILAHFQRPPYGWDKDAVHGALVCLCASGRLLAKDTRSGEAITAKDLDPQRIPKTTFHTESVRLSAKDKIALRGLFQSLGVACRPDDDLNGKTREFLDKLLGLGGLVGGEAPLPARPNLTEIEDLKGLSGNEQLAEVLNKQATLKRLAIEWKQQAELAKNRIHLWQRLQELLACGDGDAGLSLQEVRKSAAIIVQDRLLLETNDHVSPLIHHATDVLRASLKDCRRRYNEVWQREIQRLEAAEIWQKLDAAQREQLLGSIANSSLDDVSIGTEEGLLSALRETPLRHWNDRIDAMSSRIEGLLVKAAQLLEPKVQRVSLPTGTIRNKEELDAWLAQARAVIESRLDEGPVIL